MRFCHLIQYRGFGAVDDRRRRTRGKFMSQKKKTHNENYLRYHIDVQRRPRNCDVIIKLLNKAVVAWPKLLPKILRKKSLKLTMME
jgi:hypothetical protein